MKHLVDQLLLYNGMVHTTVRPSKRPRTARNGRTAKPARRTRVESASKRANAEYKALLRYLRAAVGILPKAECQLLLEFAETAKQKCERLRRALRPCFRSAIA